MDMQKTYFLKLKNAKSVNRGVSVLVSVHKCRSVVFLVVGVDHLQVLKKLPSVLFFISFSNTYY